MAVYENARFRKPDAEEARSLLAFRIGCKVLKDEADGILYS
jgi:hypothetical protein